MSLPFLSVIVPAYNGTGVLPRCFAALLATELDRSEWELIVVDDSSEDATAALAGEVADRVIRLEGGPRGPGYARNQGCAHALGEILVFIDADVCVHPDTLGKIAQRFRGSDLASVFGAYDDEPEGSDFISQYRNLLHRYHHVMGEGEAETFWAGCGAIRADAFHAVGGYDADRYPRPQIEDIELGYRLRDRGLRIEIDPAIQAKHLKRWSFSNMVRTDVFDRGIPWMRLLLERGPQTQASLNVDNTEKVKTVLAASSLLFFLAAIVAFALGAHPWIGFVALFLALEAPIVLTLWNLPMYRWFARVKGWGFALRVIPFQYLYYVLNGFAAAMGIFRHVRAGRPQLQTSTSHSAVGP